MASKAKIARNKHREKLAAKYAKKRKQLKKIVSDPNASMEAKYEAIEALQKLPRNSSPVRIRNRCQVTGRPRAYYRKFAMSRIALRDLGLRGEIPGLTKSSW
ncbi:MAG: 30S ribosomal protein S14 [Myxococcota bacterium]